MRKVGDYLIFAPHGANAISLYNVVEKSFEKIEIKDTFEGKKREYEKHLFEECVSKNEIISESKLSLSSFLELI